jgi:hypothetical protein
MVGGDMPTRVFATFGIAVLIVMSIPGTSVQFPAFKIAALIGSEIGAVFLMLGLFFSRKTHFAGLTLILIPLLMLWFVWADLSWVAIGIGLMSLAEGLLNLTTRKCGINKLLGVNSCKM